MVCLSDDWFAGSIRICHQKRLSEIKVMRPLLAE